MTLMNISKQLIKYAMISVFACLLWSGEGRASPMANCVGNNKYQYPHNQLSTNCSTDHCADKGAAEKAGTFTATPSSIKQRDQQGCLWQMPVDTNYTSHISAMVGVRTDYDRNGDGTRPHQGVDVAIKDNDPNAKIYAPAQAIGATYKVGKFLGWGKGKQCTGTSGTCMLCDRMSNITLTHKRGSSNKQRGCDTYKTVFYHVQNIQTSKLDNVSSANPLAQGEPIATAGGCQKYAVHMHYEIWDCDNTLYSPTCDSNGGPGDPQQLCDGTENTLKPTDDFSYGDTGGYGPGTAGTNPYMKEIEDCCQYATDMCKAESDLASTLRPAPGSGDVVACKKECSQRYGSGMTKQADFFACEEACNNPKQTPAPQNGKIIFVGDSRTVGMAGAKGAPITGTKFPRTANGVGKDGNYWLAKEGAQISWLTSNKSTIDGLLPNYGTIVIALGVNDVTNQNNYIKTVNSYAQQWQAQGKKVYFSLVTGVDEQKEATAGYSVKNTDISTFNNAIKSGLSGVSIIDATSVVGGNNTGGDGLHYTSDGYDKLYNSFVSQVKSGGMGTGGGGGYAGVEDGSKCSACKVKTTKQQQCERKNEAIRNGGIYCESGELSPTWQTDCLHGPECQKNCNEKYTNPETGKVPAEKYTEYSACYKACLEKGEGEGKEESGSTDGNCNLTKIALGSELSKIGRYAVRGPSGKTKDLDPELNKIIQEASVKTGLPVVLLAAFIQTETEFRNCKDAVSEAGAIGCMQIMPGTWNGLVSDGTCSGNIRDRRDNILCGAAYYKSLLEHEKIKGDPLKAIAAYNCGPNRDCFLRSDWQTCIPDESKAYIQTLPNYINALAEYNHCSTTDLGNMALAQTCQLPPGCKDYRVNPSGEYGSSSYGSSGGGSDGSFDEEHECNIAESYNNIKGCMFCRLFRVVFDASSKIARQCHNVFAQSMIPLLAIGLAIVIALIVLKYVSNWSQQDWAQMLNELFRKIFVIAFLILLLKIDVTDFFNMFVTPIFNTGFKLATMIMGNTTCDTSITGTVDGSGLPSSMGNSMLCAIYAIQQRLDKMMALGSNSLCIAFWIKSYWHIPIFPHFGYLLTGLFLWLGAIIFMMAYPFLLIDSVIQFCIASSLFPIAIASTGFKLTSKYLNIWKIVNIFASAMFSFIFLTIILCILLQGIDDAVKPVVERAYSSASGGFFDLDTLMWCSKAFVKIIFFIFVGKSVLEYIPEFAEQYAKAISNNASGTSNLGIGRKVGGTAANFVGQSTKWAGGKAKDMASGAAHAKIFGKDGDEYSLADMFNGARMGVGKQLQGTVTGIAYGIGRVTAAKFGGIRHNYIVNRTMKKMKRQGIPVTAQAGAGSSQASMAQIAPGQASAAAAQTPQVQTVQGRTWYGQKVQRRVITNPDGTMVLESSRKSLFRGREVTKLEDDHMSITQKTYKNGEIKESYDIKDPRLHNLIKEDGTRNQVKMDELMQNSSLSAELKNKIILNQMLKQRLPGIDKTFGSSMVSMNGKFVNENVSSYLNEQGQKVFEVRRVDKKGNVNVYKMTQGQTRDLVEYERISANGDSVKLSSDGIIQRKEKGHYNLNQDGTLRNSTTAIVNGQEMSGLQTSTDGIVRDQEGNVLGRIQSNGAITDLNVKTIGTLQVKAGIEANASVTINGAELSGWKQENGNLLDKDGHILGKIGQNGNIVDASNHVIGTMNQNSALNTTNSTLMINGAEVKDWHQENGVIFDKDNKIIAMVADNGNVIQAHGRVQQTDLVFGFDGHALGRRTIHGTIVNDSGVVVGRIGDDGEIIGMNNQVVGAMSAQEQESLEKMRSNRKSEFSNSKVFKGVELFDHNGNKLIDDEIMFDTSATDLYRHQMNYYGDVLNHKEFGS